MSIWAAVFEQSRVNNGYYSEGELPERPWQWPQGTWLQGRLEYVRRYEPASTVKFLGKLDHELRMPLDDPRKWVE